MKKNIYAQIIAAWGMVVGLLFGLSLQVQAQTTELSITGPAVQDWTAPATGGPFHIRITAVGGGGGIDNNNSYFPASQGNGGTGATIVGEVLVNAGTVLRAIAGDGAPQTVSSQFAGGGGGGSGVVDCCTGDCANGLILVLAAGGQGAGIYLNKASEIEGLGGSATLGGSGEGGDSRKVPKTGVGGGGGGLLSAGVIGTDGTTGGGQVSKTGLSAGGAPDSNCGYGGAGMGGGGGGSRAGSLGGGGGGGGYTGGDGAKNWEIGAVPPATSYNILNLQVNTDGITGGSSSSGTSGSVLIECFNCSETTPNYPTITIAPMVDNVSESMGSSLVFRFTRTVVSDAALIVQYRLSGLAEEIDYNLSASAGGRLVYDATTETRYIVFAPGAATVDLNVMPINDELIEGNETVNVTLESRCQ